MQAIRLIKAKRIVRQIAKLTATPDSTLENYVEIVGLLAQLEDIGGSTPMLDDLIEEAWMHLDQATFDVTARQWGTYL